MNGKTNINAITAAFLRCCSIVSIVVFIAVIIPGQVFSAPGWVIVELNTNPYGLMSMQTTFIQGNKVRIETSESVIILDLEAGDMSLVYPTRMVYWKGKPSEFREGMIRTAEVQITSAIEQLPSHEREVQRKELEKMLQLMASDSMQSTLISGISIREAGLTDTIAGTLARCFEVFVDSVLYEKVWITRDIDPFSKVDQKAMKTMTRELTRPTVVSAYRESDVFTNLVHGGFVVKSVLPTSIGESVTHVESFRNMDIRADLFVPPVDYRPAGLIEIIQMGTAPTEGIMPPGM